jgi:hypothetical protein
MSTTAALESRDLQPADTAAGRRALAALVISAYHRGYHVAPLDRCGDLLCVGVRELLAWT